MIFLQWAVISIDEENTGKYIFGYRWLQNPKIWHFENKKNLERVSRAKSFAIFTLGAETTFSRAMYRNRIFLDKTTNYKTTNAVSKKINNSLEMLLVEGNREVLKRVSIPDNVFRFMQIISCSQIYA